MNLIRQMRRKAQVTQQDLATRAGTSQATVAAYECGSKSPTLRTVQKFAQSLNVDLFVVFEPRMTREDRRSLAFHHAIADKLIHDPKAVTSQALQNLNNLTRLHPNASSLFKRWSKWLDLPTEDLITQILDPGVTAREMRQVSPFSGILSAAERAQVLKAFRKERAA